VQGGRGGGRETSKEKKEIKTIILRPLKETIKVIEKRPPPSGSRDYILDYSIRKAKHST